MGHGSVAKDDKDLILLSHYISNKILIDLLFPVAYMFILTKELMFRIDGVHSNFISTKIMITHFLGRPDFDGMTPTSSIIWDEVTGIIYLSILALIVRYFLSFIDIQ